MLCRIVDGDVLIFVLLGFIEDGIGSKIFFWYEMYCGVVLVGIVIILFVISINRIFNFIIRISCLRVINKNYNKNWYIDNVLSDIWFDLFEIGLLNY